MTEKSACTRRAPSSSIASNATFTALGPPCTAFASNSLTRGNCVSASAFAKSLAESRRPTRPGSISNAPDGRSALEAVLQHRPQLVLLDFILPELRGDEVLLQLRNDAAYNDVKDTYVVILSDHADALSQHDLQRLGANHVMSKHSDPQEIRERVKSALLGIQ